MKKLFITAAIATLFSVSVFADGAKKSNTTVNVSTTVLAQFDADFVNVQNVNWTVDRSFQKAQFIQDGVQKTAFYNLQGDFVALTQDVDANAVPAKTQSDIAKKFPGYKVNEVIVVQNNTEVNPDADETAYFVDLKNDSKEVLVKIASDASVEFYKEVK